MAVFLAPIINEQQENSNGAPLSGGTIEVYLAGSSTPANTYSDNAGLVLNTWPILLNTLGVNGQGAVWLTGGFRYKFIIKDSVGIVQRTIDNVSGINDSTSTADQWVTLQVTPTFVSTNSFTVPGDQTQLLQVGRRIRSTNTSGTIFSTITSSVYSAPNTTVVVSNDSGVLDSGLSLVSYALISAQSTSVPALGNFGQCRLAKSGANLVLSPYQGNRITINGTAFTIPSAGLSLAPTGLTVGTTYYIYAYMNVGVMTLEASTTGHSVDTTTGVEIKTGDPTRTLVGMARIITGPNFQDTTAQRFVASWFNRKPNSATNFGTGVGVGGTSFGELSTAARCELLSWAGDGMQMALVAAVSQNTTNGTAETGIGVDSTTVSSTEESRYQAYTSGSLGALSLTQPTAGLSEGYHFFTPLGKVNVGGTIATFSKFSTTVYLVN